MNARPVCQGVLARFFVNQMFAFNWLGRTCWSNRWLRRELVSEPHSEDSVLRMHRPRH